MNLMDESLLQRPWIASYPKGVPYEVVIDRYSSLVDMFSAQCEEFTTLPAFVYLGYSMSFSELLRISRQFSAFLQGQLHLQKGERIALILPNVLSFPVVMFGALQAGLIVVLVNPLYTERELLVQLKDADVKVAVVLEPFAYRLANILSQTRIQYVIVAKVEDGLPRFKKFLMRLSTKFIKRIIPKWQIRGAIFLGQALCLGKNLRFSPIELKKDDIAFLQYTGGTTGSPKGAMLTHQNLMANVWQCLAWVESSLSRGTECILTALPLYHVFSLTVCCFCFMALGTRNVLIPNPKDLSSVIRQFSRYQPSIFVGVDTLFKALLQHPAFGRLNFSVLKVVIAGGMSLREAVAKEWKSTTNTQIIEGYGLTEASPVISINPLTLNHFNGSVGLPIPNTDVAILDDQQNLLPLNEVGEICVRGPQVMKGYWRQQKETEQIFQDGWLKTGDVGCMDTKGFIYLVDRKKDLILVSGFNVYPKEIEEVLSRHPKILQAAVLGVPSSKSGETVKAFVVPKDSTLTTTDVMAYCRTYLTGYKVPTVIEFCSQLPTSSVGKILKYQLKRKY